MQTDRLLVVDIETTGTNPALHDPVAIALAPFSADLAPLLVHIRPPAPVWTAFARENLARFASSWEREAVAPVEAATRIEEYVRGAGHGQPMTLVGHNVGFDLSFLRKLAALAGRTDIAGLSHRAVDTYSMLFCAWLGGKVPLEALTSDGAFKHFRIPVESSARHTALGDALATRSLFMQLVEMFEDSAVETRDVVLPRRRQSHRRQVPRL